MKRFIFKTLAMMLVAALFMTTSCKEQDVTFREYVVEGGIRYLGSVAGAKASVGIDRIELSFSVADAETSMVGVFWNDYGDSLMIDVTGGEQVNRIIPLKEGSYTLFLKSYDSKGNSSNPLELSARSVGSNFISTITHRGMSKLTSGNNDLRLTWSNAETYMGARFTELIYTTVNGNEKRIRIENSSDLTVIDDYKDGTAFRRTTYYSPDNQWLDTIIPGWRIENTITFAKSRGSVIDFSSEDGSNTAALFYDGNTQNTWLTNKGYPEYATIDIGAELPVAGIGITPATQFTNGLADPRAPTRVRIEASRDNENWVNLGEYSYDNSLYTTDTRNFEVPLTNARYIRFTGLECTFAPVFGSGIGGPGTNKMALSELSVYIQLY